MKLFKQAPSNFFPGGDQEDEEEVLLLGGGDEPEGGKESEETLPRQRDQVERGKENDDCPRKMVLFRSSARMTLFTLSLNT